MYTIKYTGPKPQKKVELNDATYIFNPTCEVYNKEHIVFLLNPDKKGLFEVVPDEPKDEGTGKEDAKEPDPPKEEKEETVKEFPVEQGKKEEFTKDELFAMDWNSIRDKFKPLYEHGMKKPAFIEKILESQKGE
jgi:hypothetical protein